MKTTFLFRLLFIVIAFATVPLVCQASLLVYEGFDYPPNQELAGLEGGIGFGGFWEPGKASDAGSITSGLTFSDYPVSGNAALITSKSGTNRAGNQRLLNADFGSAPQTVWMSFLYFYDVVPGASPWFHSGMQTSTFAKSAKSSRASMRGNSGGRNFGAAYQSGSETMGGTNSPATTYLMIGKFVSGSGMTVWALSAVNYDRLKGGGITEEKLNHDCLWTKTDKPPEMFEDDTLFDYVSIGSSTLGKESTLSVTMDELKYGQTLEDVLTIPATPAKK